MRRSVIFLVLMIGLGQARADEITLDEAIRTALRQNRDLVTLELALRSRYIGVDDAEAAFLVTLQPDGAAGVSDGDGNWTYGVRATKRQAMGSRLEAGAQMSYFERDGADASRVGTVRVGIEQPLLKNFGPLVNLEPIRRAESSVRAARRELELRKADLVVQVVETFEGLLRLQEQVRFDEQSLKRFERLDRLTKSKEKQGRATRVDSLRVEFQRGRAEGSLTISKERLQSLQRDFADLLGYDPDKTFTALASPRIEIDAPEAERAARVALSNRLDYAQALDNIRDAIRGVRIARKNLLPEVNLVARHLWTSEGADYNDATRLDDTSWFLGLAGNVDVYQRGERNAWSLAVIDRQTAEQRLSTLDSALRRQVQQALLAYDRARQDVVIAEKNHALARDRARLARRLFELGRQDNFTVTDAETELSQAESAKLVAQADVSVAAYRLLRTLGTLIESPEDLKPQPL